MIALGDREHDAVRELVNIASGNAASALAQLLGQRTMISVPKLTFAPIEDISTVLGSSGQPNVVVAMQVLGDVTGLRFVAPAAARWLWPRAAVRPGRSRSSALFPAASGPAPLWRARAARGWSRAAFGPPPGPGAFSPPGPLRRLLGRSPWGGGAGAGRCPARAAWVVGGSWAPLDVRQAQRLSTSPGSCPAPTATPA